MQKSTVGSGSIIIGLLMYLSITGSPGQADKNDPLNSPVTAAEQSLVNRSNGFGLELFRRVAAESDPDSNLLISPLSVSYALAMTYNGAAGRTQLEIARTLRLPDMPDDVLNGSFKGLIRYLSENDKSVIMHIANSVWYQPGVAARRQFIEKMNRYFGAAVRELNFTDPAGIDTINNWVAENTRDRISHIIQPPLDPDIVMILVNAIYFNGAWSIAFDPARTETADFQMAHGPVISCSMMHRSDTVRLVSSETYQAVELPYGDGLFSMTLILPRAGYSADNMIKQLTENIWDSLVSGLATEQVDLRLPRFAFSDDHGLNRALKAMGMEIPFTPQADFSQMIEGGGIWIDSVIHKTRIKVEEKGTEAAAATAVMMEKGLNRLSITFDRPFLFAIRERDTGAIVFIGKVAQPVFEDEAK